MLKKYRISFGLVAAILLASLLMLNAFTPQKDKATCCKKSPAQCSGDLKKEAPTETTLENLSHQFIMLPISIH